MVVFSCLTGIETAIKFTYNIETSPPKSLILGEGFCVPIGASQI